MADGVVRSSLAVVIPAHNEEAAIARVLSGWAERLNALAVDYWIHIYDDGSTDGTRRVVDEIALRLPRLVVHGKTNSGHGPTILGGYRENCDREWIFQVDSDDEMHPEYFDRLWTARADHDLLIGCRIGRQGPPLRRVMTWVCHWAVKILYGGGIQDVNSPYRLMRTKFFKEYYNLVSATTFAPNVLLSGAACLNGARILEIAVPFVPKPAEEALIKKWKPFSSAVRSFAEAVRFRVVLWLR